MKNKKLILYIHGWNSYAGARKALLLQDMLKNNSDFEVASITLDSHPRHAIRQLEKIIEKEIKTRKVNLIGSSLGGYYATFLSEKYDLKAAMINPAVSAYKIFKNDMGININPNTQEEYIIDEDWVLALEEIFVENLTKRKNFLVLLQTGDATLNYKFSELYYEGCNLSIDDGGSHSFDNLESKLPAMLLHFSN